MTRVSSTYGPRLARAPKINLTLRVLGIRPDGYHELRTTFQSLALHDTLTFSARRGPFTIAADDPRCPTDGSNLVWKAAARLWEAGGPPWRDGRGRRAHPQAHPDGGGARGRQQ